MVCPWFQDKKGQYKEIDKSQISGLGAPEANGCAVCSTGTRASVGWGGQLPARVSPGTWTAVHKPGGWAEAGPQGGL